MSHYSKNPAMVRVDFFKESGKWYATEEMEWIHYSEQYQIHDAFAWSLRSAFNGMYSGMTAVCLEPYHAHAHPVMLQHWDSYKPTPFKV